ncbi:MAG: hypothetical protein ACR2PX_24165 [Endozoicomonas sp.]
MDQFKGHACGCFRGSRPTLNRQTADQNGTRQHRNRWTRFNCHDDAF